jgi:hypothetical protein
MRVLWWDRDCSSSCFVFNMYEEFLPLWLDNTIFES